MSSVRSIERAFSLLEAVSVSELGITGLAERVGIPKSTAARILKTLEAVGAVEKGPDDGVYRIGPKVHGLTAEKGRSAELVHKARPHLEMLAGLLGEDAGLAVQDGNQVHYITQEDADNNVVVRDWTGTLLPMYVVPSGLVILAHWPQEQLDHYLAETLEPYTRRTVTDPALIRNRLNRIRDEGWVWVIEEFVEGINSVASPVYDDRGRVLAAVHVHGPSYRFPGRSSPESIAAAVAEAAARVSAA